MLGFFLLVGAVSLMYGSVAETIRLMLGRVIQLFTV